jgi:hypothetical protein
VVANLYTWWTMKPAPAPAPGVPTTAPASMPTTSNAR